MSTLASPRVRGLLLALAVLGFVLPWWFNWRYLAGGGGLGPAEFFGAAFANSLTTAITLDVYLAALAFSVAVGADRAAGPRRWWAIPITFCVGLAFALPGYLWWRGSPAR
jgi:Terpene cyclase DEP1